MTLEDTRGVTGSTSKELLKKLIPNALLRQRDIIQRLGPRAGRIYTNLMLLDLLGMRTSNRNLAPASARSFVFICHGNIMRSAMSEFFIREFLIKAGLEKEFHIVSAGLHAVPGKEAHPWAQQASTDLGISLAAHRAKPMTRTMAEQADSILAMDFQNKAELLALYPEFRDKICMISAYAEGRLQYREIPDPYLGSLETTKQCAAQLQTCLRNLLRSVAPSSATLISQSDDLKIPSAKAH